MILHIIYLIGEVVDEVQIGEKLFRLIEPLVHQLVLWILYFMDVHIRISVHLKVSTEKQKEKNMHKNERKKNTLFDQSSSIKISDVQQKGAKKFHIFQNKL